jgi:hypothetical protein
MSLKVKNKRWGKSDANLNFDNIIEEEEKEYSARTEDQDPIDLKGSKFENPHFLELDQHMIK